MVAVLAGRREIRKGAAAARGGVADAGLLLTELLTGS